MLAMRFPMQHATWTDGPSLPTDRPEAMTRGYTRGHRCFIPIRTQRRTKVTLLTKNVQKPKKPFMTNPAMMHLISEIPEPAAYFAKDRTRCAATKEKAAYGQFFI